MGGVLAARPWDAVVVDEAHAARRRVFGAEEPNLLLRLLQEMKQRRLFRCLWLLTATPMQLAAHEVHDLLLLAGVDDHRWGPWADLREFERFFERLRSFATVKNDRAEVVAMTRRAVEIGAPDLSPAEVPTHWTELQWRSLVQRIQANGAGLALSLQGLLPQQAEGMTPYLARETPLAVYMFRHTRQTLRAYRERGLLKAGLADRQPEDVPVAFQSPAEEALYRRIDELCSKFYRLAEVEPDERSGVGFLMAVFRKRLASSFAAQGPRRVPKKELHPAFAKGWSVESIEPSGYEVRPDLKEITFRRAGRGRGSWWCGGSDEADGSDRDSCRPPRPQPHPAHTRGGGRH